MAVVTAVAVPNGDLIEANGLHPETRGNLDIHQNGITNKSQLELKPMDRPIRDDTPLEADVFPDTTEGRLLKGLARSFLIKQEPRMGWARKRACDEEKLLLHPCEVVASHQWGVMWLCLAISKTADFLEELPEFDHAKAYEMASIHDLAELVTGDITPVDGISSEKKHEMESEAMTSILGFYPGDVTKELTAVYDRYEKRQCIESKFIKDCDKLDFMITAFMLERQKFSGFDEFYDNSNKHGFHTKIAQRLADELIATRAQLIATKSL